MSTTVERNASEDGSGNTLNLSDNWKLNVGGFSCTKSCTKVTAAAVSGWFDMPITVNGAYSVATSAAVMFGATSLF